VVPDFPSILLSHCFTTSPYLPRLFPWFHSAVGDILLIVAIFTAEVSANSCDSCWLSCLEVSQTLREISRNLVCNMGATQPIEIFLPPTSRKSMQLCGFVTFPTLFIMVHAMDLLPPSLRPLSFSLHWSFPSLFGWVVRLHRMCSIPFILLLLTLRNILCLYP
jgi:hypothetical protein